MNLKSIAFGGAAIVGLAAIGLSMPATAYTHHPATPEEQRQTDDLNAQQLAQAQSTTQNTVAQAGAPSNMLASAAPASAVTVSLDAVANPPQTLANASVETVSGQAVGAVQKVIIGSDGKAQTLDIALLGPQSKIVSIDAAQLSYDQSRNVVVAQLSVDQIQALPATPQG